MSSTWAGRWSSWVSAMAPLTPSLYLRFRSSSSTMSSKSIQAELSEHSDAELSMGPRSSALAMRAWSVKLKTFKIFGNFSCAVVRSQGASCRVLRNLIFQKCLPLFFVKSMSSDCEALRQEGNEHFKAKRFNNAVKSYSKALELAPSAVLLSNRAQAYLKLER